MNGNNLNSGNFKVQMLKREADDVTREDICDFSLIQIRHIRVTMSRFSRIS